MQLHLHSKPVGLLNTAGYFDPLLTWLDHMVREGFLRQGHRDLLLVASEPAELLDRLRDWQPNPAASKWLDPEVR